MALYARLNPDTAGKLAMHAYSCEHMEHAAYELLRWFAERAGDERVAELARRVGEHERSMADRIAGRWDCAVDASLREEDAGTSSERPSSTDATRTLWKRRMLEAGSKLTECGALAAIMSAHLAETHLHQRRIDERLRDVGFGRVACRRQRCACPRSIWVGASRSSQTRRPSWRASPNAFEALECGAYELLRRTARRAGDEATADAC
jgi:ferritin-like metal-binding protein YciE